MRQSGNIPVTYGGLGETKKDEPGYWGSFFTNVFNTGADIYKAQQDLDAAIKAGASAAQIAAMQASLQAMQEQRYRDDQRRNQMMMAAVGVAVLGTLAFVVARKRPAARRRR